MLMLSSMWIKFIRLKIGRAKEKKILEAEEVEIGEEEEEEKIHVNEDSGRRYNLNNTTGVAHSLDKR